MVWQESYLESSVRQNGNADQRIGGFVYYTNFAEDRTKVGMVSAEISCSVAERYVERSLPPLCCQVELRDDSWVRDADVGPAVNQPWFMDGCLESWGDCGSEL